MSGQSNDLDYQDAKRTVVQRSAFTDPDENLRILDAGLLWRLMEVTPPETFRRVLAEAVQFVTPDAVC